MTLISKKKPAPYKIWGEDLDQEAVGQMDDACHLPVSIRGALMPDAHKGYGLPIGGVLAVEKAGTLISAGLDEAPMAYKDIREVMALQQDLVDIVAVFHPMLVKMAAPDRR